jgi:hypothetical protein
MRTQGTAIAITKAICEGLRAWYTDQPMSTEGYTNVIGEAIDQQSRIGWRNMLEGFPAKQWAERQDNHFKRINSRRSRRRWVSSGTKTS